jgi:hypothetical protein
MDEELPTDKAALVEHIHEKGFEMQLMLDSVKGSVEFTGVFQTHPVDIEAVQAGFDNICFSGKLPAMKLGKQDHRYFLQSLWHVHLSCCKDKKNSACVMKLPGLTDVRDLLTKSGITMAKKAIPDEPFSFGQLPPLSGLLASTALPNRIVETNIFGKAKRSKQMEQQEAGYRLFSWFIKHLHDAIEGGEVDAKILNSKFTSLKSDLLESMEAGDVTPTEKEYCAYRNGAVNCAMKVTCSKGCPVTLVSAKNDLARFVKAHMGHMALTFVKEEELQTDNLGLDIQFTVSRLEIPARQKRFFSQSLIPISFHVTS